MAARATLADAALGAFEDMTVQSAAGTLDDAIAAFIAGYTASFDEQRSGDRPIINWTAVLYGYQAQMDGAVNDWTELRITADYVYRLCFLGSQLRSQSSISVAQAAAILAAYNANFG